MTYIRRQGDLKEVHIAVRAGFSIAALIIYLK